MITDSFDPAREAIINPPVSPDAPEVDALLLTFSFEIEAFVLKNYPVEKLGEMKAATGTRDVYLLRDGGKRFAFFKTYVGAPGCVGAVEDSFAVCRTKKVVAFGGAGCLAKEIAHGKVMVPTEAYRDEGTSYHYAPPSDYITVKNAGTVARFMEENGLPYVLGRNWTTDAFFRETRANFEKRKADGCISVDMECSALQALCDFRGLEFYTFFTSGDLLDAPEWDERHEGTSLKGTQHDVGHFAIALELAKYVSEKA